MSIQLRTYALMLGVTGVAYLIGGWFPLVGHSILAIVFGMIIAHTPLIRRLDRSTIQRTSNHLLKFSIVLMGLTLSFAQIKGVGLSALAVIIPVVLTAFIVALIAGHALGIPRKSSLLIGMGTAICGGSAIAAGAPVIEAEDSDITYALTTVFIYNALALFIFQGIGHWLQLTDLTYGVFCGTAINDTSSVVAAGFGWSDLAGQTATIVKLVRTLMIVPCVLGLIAFRYRNHATGQRPSLRQIVPAFIVQFVIAVIITSLVPIPKPIIHFIGQTSRFLITLALTAIGLNVDFHSLKQSGIRPLLLGGITWASVIAMSLIAIRLFY